MSKLNSTKTLREFGLLVGIIFPVLIGWIIPYLFGHDFRSWTLIIGLPLLLLGILSPNKLKYPYQFWIKIGNALGYINSRIILGTVFYLLLFPLAVIMKMSGYDPLKKRSTKLNTYRQIRENDRIDLEKIF